MNAGRLKEVITIQKPTISQNEYGANGTQWTDYITTRSDVQFESGNRDTENSEIVLTILRYSLLGIIITQMKKIGYCGMESYIESYQQNQIEISKASSLEQN